MRALVKVYALGKAYALGRGSQRGYARWSLLRKLSVGLFGAASLLLLGSGVSEHVQRAECDQRLAELGDRAPRWRSACHASTRSAALVLTSVLERFPALPTPEVRVDERFLSEGGAEVDAKTGAIRINPRSPLVGDEAVWVHELAHVQARGVRPTEDIAVRLLRAYEEGVADYYAASLLAQPALGRAAGHSGGEALRDLAAPVELPATRWAALALGAAGPHLFGQALASELWRRERGNPQLAQDLLVSLADLSPGASAARGTGVLRFVLAACPARSRESLRLALSAWLPSELWAATRLEPPAGARPPRVVN